MSGRRETDLTVEEALAELFPDSDPDKAADLGQILATKSLAKLTVRDLYGATFGAREIVRERFDCIGDGEYVWQPTAAVYCCRSEITVERCVVELGGIEEAVARKDLSMRQAHETRVRSFALRQQPERTYRMGWVRTDIKPMIESALKAGVERRKETIKAKQAMTMRDAQTQKVPWVEDDEAHLHSHLIVTNLTKEQVAAIIRKAGGVVRLTLAEALARPWISAAARDPWERGYFGLLKRERLNVEHWKQATVANQENKSLEKVLARPTVARPKRRR